MSTLIANILQGINTINHDASTTIGTLDANGISPNISPSFLLRQSGTTTYGSGSYNEIIKIGLFTNLHDTDSAIDSDGIFTVPSGKGGLYFFAYGSTFSGLGNSMCSSILRIDGSDDQTTEEYFRSEITNFPFRSVAMVKLNAGQTVIPRAQQSSGSTKSDDGAGNRKGFFGGVRIS